MKAKISEHKSMDRAAASIEPPPAHNWTTPPVSYKDAASKIGVLSDLAPRPTATNIHTLRSILCDRIMEFHCTSLYNFWYVGMVEEAMVHALTRAPPWLDYLDPGACRDRTDRTATSVEQKDDEAKYIAGKRIFDYQTNVRRTIDALNLAVPRSYKSLKLGNRIGAKIHKTNVIDSHADRKSVV